jgi:hypothetical protein
MATMTRTKPAVTDTVPGCDVRSCKRPAAPLHALARCEHRVCEPHWSVFERDSQPEAPPICQVCHPKPAAASKGRIKWLRSKLATVHGPPGQWVVEPAEHAGVLPNGTDVLPTRAKALRRANVVDERKTGPVTATDRPQSKFLDGAMALRFGT